MNMMMTGLIILSFSIGCYFSEAWGWMAFGAGMMIIGLVSRLTRNRNAPKE